MNVVGAARIIFLTGAGSFLGRQRVFSSSAVVSVGFGDVDGLFDVSVVLIGDGFVNFDVDVGCVDEINFVALVGTVVGFLSSTSLASVEDFWVLKGCLVVDVDFWLENGDVPVLDDNKSV